MLGKDFEIGKLYCNKRDATSKGRISWWTISRYCESHVVCVSSTLSYYKPFDHTELIAFLSSDYDEVPFDELTSEEQIQLTLFMAKHGVNLAATQKQQSQGCTCEIMALMSTGCTCGWIQKERSKS